MNDVFIEKFSVALDREAAYDLLLALSELHGRKCAEIGKCDDMVEATQLARDLIPLCNAYNAVEKRAARFDNRDPNLLNVPE